MNLDYGAKIMSDLLDCSILVSLFGTELFIKSESYRK